MVCRHGSLISYCAKAYFETAKKKPLRADEEEAEADQPNVDPVSVGIFIDN